MDNASFFDKVKRFTKLSSSIGGLATHVAGKKVLGLNTNDNIYAQKLKDQLGNLKGPIVKIAQFLATIPDAIPNEYTQQLLELQSNAPSMGKAFVKRRMACELGANWLSKFKTFDMEAKSAASLGQVHQAWHHDGTLLACKLQYPQMVDTIQNDLNSFGMFLGLYHTFNKAVDTTNILAEIKDRLLEELDYENEALNISIYKEIFNHQSYVDIPKVFQELSTKRLLTMNWLPGKPLLQCINNSQKFKENVGRNLFNTWYLPFYHHGYIHGDPHPGNYLIQNDESVSLLDFGCIRKFDHCFVQAVVNLYQAFKQNKPDLAVHAYKQWGFKNISKEMIEVINHWALLLYGPLLDDRVRPIQENFSGAQGWEVATKIHKKLGEMGGIEPPREFVFMDRAAVGLGSVLMRLRIELNWHQMFEEIINSSPILNQ